MDERKSIKGFYECVRRTFFVCRVAGYLPITGLRNEKGKFSKYVGFSHYTIYHAFSVFLTIICVLIHLYDALQTRRLFRDLGGLVLQVFAVLSSIFLMRFSMTWDKMIKRVEDNEQVLPSFKNPQCIFGNINRIMLSMFVFGFVDHLVHLLMTVRITFLCNSDEVSFEKYYTFYYRWLFDNIKFTYVTAFLLQFTKFQTTFVYYFIDYLVTVVTLYLVYRFRNFNRLMRIRQIKCTKNRNVPWMDLQAHYTRLTRLVKIVDDYVNPFVFLSFLSNLVVICKKVYDIIHSDWIVILDSFVPMTYLIFRTTLVSTLTTHLHTLSREPLRALHTLPPSAYTLEVQRFMDQVYYSKIHLSGLGYFYVTRATILSMLSTIVTYELVFLQLPRFYPN